MSTYAEVFCGKTQQETKVLFPFCCLNTIRRAQHLEHPTSDCSRFPTCVCVQLDIHLTMYPSTIFLGKRFFRQIKKSYGTKAFLRTQSSFQGYPKTNGRNHNPVWVGTVRQIARTVAFANFLLVHFLIEKSSCFQQSFGLSMFFVASLFRCATNLSKISAFETKVSTMHRSGDWMRNTIGKFKRSRFCDPINFIFIVLIHPLRITFQNKNDSAGSLFIEIKLKEL